jgi:TetR/AcrR family tetracycline transcriptional repressor
MALDRDTVIRSALRLLDETGIEGLTVRRIAAELNVQAPALYWHFKNKQALIDAMATTVLLDVAASVGPPASGSDWREYTARYMRALRAGLLAHRDGARILPGTYVADPEIYTAMESALALMNESGFSTADATLVLNTLYCYTIGFALEEQAVHPRPGEMDERYAPGRREQRVDPTIRTRAAEAGPVLFADFDARFERALAIILAGAEATRGGSPASRPGR